MRLKGLDLNLLVALDVLLEQRSVSRSAERLRLSQGAVSAALGRLREYFDDELLVLHGKQMIPTAYAESLGPAVKKVLADADVLIAMSSEFDAAVTQRTFRIVASDYIEIVLLAPLIAKLEKAAPGIKLEIRFLNEQVWAEFERGEVDLSIGPEHMLRPKYPMELLFEELFVVVGCVDNPVFAEPLTVARFTETPQVGVRVNRDQVVFVEKHLRQLGIERRIDVYAPSFLVLPWLIIGTRRVAVIQAALARNLERILPLKIVPLPVSIPPMPEMMQFHSARETDAGLVWLRDQVRAVAKEVSSDRPLDR